jgi:hypothetical protein
LRVRPARPAAFILHADRQIEDDNDGSGSIKDFRTKMWTSAQKEHKVLDRPTPIVVILDLPVSVENEGSMGEGDDAP